MNLHQCGSGQQKGKNPVPKQQFGGVPDVSAGTLLEFKEGPDYKKHLRSVIPGLNFKESAQVSFCLFIKKSMTY